MATWIIAGKVIGNISLAAVLLLFVLISGDERAREFAGRIGIYSLGRSEAETRSRGYWIAAFVLSRRVWFAVAVILFIYSFADLTKQSLVKSYVEENWRNFLILWTLCVLIVQVGKSIARFYGSIYVRLYVIVIADTISRLRYVSVGLLRLWAQLVILVIVPIVAVTILPYNLPAERTVPLMVAYVWAGGLYLLLLTVSFVVVKNRSTKRAIFEDVGYCLSSLATVNILLFNNQIRSGQIEKILSWLII